jgi:hypothetical protein
MDPISIAVGVVIAIAQRCRLFGRRLRRGWLRWRCGGLCRLSCLLMVGCYICWCIGVMDAIDNCPPRKRARTNPNPLRMGLS